MTLYKCISHKIEQKDYCLHVPGDNSKIRRCVASPHEQRHILMSDLSQDTSLQWDGK